MARKFSKAKLDQFKQLFTEKRNALIEKINKSSEEELDTDGDDVDKSQGKVLSEQASILSKREITTLQKLDTAIKKIGEGTFGVCEECDGRIGEKRLMAIPGCDLCIECAEEQEKYDRQFSQAN